MSSDVIVLLVPIIVCCVVICCCMNSKPWKTLDYMGNVDRLLTLVAQKYVRWQYPLHTPLQAFKTQKYLKEVAQEYKRIKEWYERNKPKIVAHMKQKGLLTEQNLCNKEQVVSELFDLYLNAK